MDARKDKTDELLYHAHRCIYFNERLIEQCETWLSAEEGNENLMRRIRERKELEIKNYELKITKK
jgi:hypothetical protein